ncbi:MAG: DNA primase noncatalytic subunit PriX [Candidatus Nitrosopolaris sp.]
MLADHRENVSREKDFKASLDFILSHFEKPIWPRTIFTPKEKQVLVYSTDEALAKFRQARFLDCRINAYPSYTGWKGLNRQAPNFLFIDLDLSRLKSIEALDRALKKTLKFIKEKLGDDVSPSVLWTGNGYHIYLPVSAFILELESMFAEFEEPSKQFIRWTEQFLSNNKADPCHSNSLSFKNCMLRIPGSFNSKLVHLIDKGKIVNIPESAEVKIIQKCNAVRPSISPLLSDFYIYLANSKIKQIHKNRKSRKYSVHYENNKIRWIETLLQLPIPDHRKHALWRIVTPYLIKVRKLSYEDAFSIIMDWLDKCDKLKPLDFSVNNRIKSNLSAAGRVGYLPIGFGQLKTENRQLADLISHQMKNAISLSYERE